ncbi:DinB family protein [Roseibacillus persicicus]|uniref:DinB family protein n=1 Tax=Roseibacillus persicicus TaxID=454148 RepID=UPI00398ADD72
MTALIDANLSYLAQAERLLELLDDGAFTRSAAGFYHSTIGGHLRHCLDHYDSFITGLPDGKVDYDARMRLPELESQTASALVKTSEIREGLQQVTRDALPGTLQVKMDCGFRENDWQPSSPGRELQFLVSHTVHHFAMIGGICRELGIELEDGFGIAPSTLRHRSALSV